MTGLLAGAFPVAAVAAAAQQVVQADDYFEDAAKRFSKADYDGAIVQLKNVLQSDPTNIGARILLGRANLRKGLAQSAEKEFRIALNLGADRSEVMGALGNALLLQRKYRDILESLRVDNPLEEPTMEVRLLRARAHFELGELKQAQRGFEAARALDEDNVPAMLGLAEVLQAEGDLEGAETCIDEALRKAPQSPESWFRKAELYATRRDLEHAREYYEKTLELDPSHHRARLGLASAAYDLGDYQAALDNARTVHEQSPRDAIAAFIRAQAAARLGDMEQARAALDSARESVTALSDEALSRDPARLQVAGVVHYLAGDLERANRYLTMLLKIRPQHHGMRRLLGFIQLEMGDPKAAVDTLYPLKQVYPNDPDLLGALGDAYLKLGRFVEASNIFEEAVDAAPDEGRLQMRLAMSHLGSGREGEALAELQRAVATGTYRKRSGMLLAMVQLRKGRVDEALKTAREMAAADPGNPAAYNLVGAVHLKAGRFDEARRAFEKALEVMPGYRPAEQNLAKMDLAAGHVAEAKARYGAILDKNPRDAQALMGMADIALGQGDIQGAISWLEQSIGDSERQIEPQLKLISLHLQNDDATNAHSIATRLAQRFPENSQVVEALARTQAALGHTDAAQTSYRRAVRFAGYSGRELMTIARGQVEVGDFDGARYTLTKASNTFMGLDALVARARLEILLEDFKNAHETVEQIRSAYPDAYQGTLVAAEIMQARGQRAQAIAALRDLLERAPEATEAAIKLYELLFGGGQREEAIALLEARHERFPDERGTTRALAMGYLAVERLEDARALHEQLLDAHPDDASLIANMARISQLTGRDDALQLARRAVALKPEWAVTLDTLGWILVTEGQAREGLKYLRQAISRDSNPLTRYHLAVALRQVGRDDEALTEVARILRESPDLDWIDLVEKLRKELQS